jgi:hypothetical protein
VIGDFTETFMVPLGFWNESDYRRSWRRAFEVLNANSLVETSQPTARPWGKPPLWSGTNRVPAETPSS